MSSEKGVFEVVWPGGKKAGKAIQLARRLDNLEGKTVACLWDWAFRGDEIFPVIEQELTKRYAGIKFVGYEAFGSTHSADERVVLASLSEKLKQHDCQAVISGVGC